VKPPIDRNAKEGFVPPSGTVPAGALYLWHRMSGTSGLLL